MQVTRATFLPLLAPAEPERRGDGPVLDEFCGELAIAYSFGPPFGKRLVTPMDLDRLELSRRGLRRSALEHLESLAGRAQFHGQPPALMLSFEGLESSLLLAEQFWARMQQMVPGELVVGVPARDVVIVTGSESRPGLEKARRAVDRVFMAGDEHLLSRRLMVRRGGLWEPFDGAPRRPMGRPPHAADQRPPREYQEHPSWPGERVPVSAMRRPTGAPAEGRRSAERPAPGRQPASPLDRAPAAAMRTVEPMGPPAVPPTGGGRRRAEDRPSWSSPSSPGLYDSGIRPGGFREPAYSTGEYPPRPAAAPMPSSSYGPPAPGPVSSAPSYPPPSHSAPTSPAARYSAPPAASPTTGSTPGFAAAASAGFAAGRSASPAGFAPSSPSASGYVTSSPSPGFGASTPSPGFGSSSPSSSFGAGPAPSSSAGFGASSAPSSSFGGSSSGGYGAGPAPSSSAGFGASSAPSSSSGGSSSGGYGSRPAPAGYGSPPAKPSYQHEPAPARPSYSDYGGYSPSMSAPPTPSAGPLPTRPVSAPAYPVSSPAYPVSSPAYPVSSPAYPVSSPAYPVSGPAYPVSGMPQSALPAYGGPHDRFVPERPIPGQRQQPGPDRRSPSYPADWEAPAEPAVSRSARPAWETTRTGARARFSR